MAISPLCEMSRDHHDLSVGAPRLTYYKMSSLKMNLKELTVWILKPKCAHILLHTCLAALIS